MNMPPRSNEPRLGRVWTGIVAAARKVEFSLVHPPVVVYSLQVFGCCRVGVLVVGFASDCDCVLLMSSNVEVEWRGDMRMHRDEESVLNT